MGAFHLHSLAVVVGSQRKMSRSILTRTETGLGRATGRVWVKEQATSGAMMRLMEMVLMEKLVRSTRASVQELVERPLCVLTELLDSRTRKRILGPGFSLRF